MKAHARLSLFRCLHCCKRGLDAYGAVLRQQQVLRPYLPMLFFVSYGLALLAMPALYVTLFLTLLPPMPVTEGMMATDEVCDAHDDWIELTGWAGICVSIAMFLSIIPVVLLFDWLRLSFARFDMFRAVSVMGCFIVVCFLWVARAYFLVNHPVTWACNGPLRNYEATRALSVLAGILGTGMSLSICAVCCTDRRSYARDVPSEDDDKDLHVTTTTIMV